MSDKKEVILEGVALYANLPPRPAQKGFESEDTSYSVLIECSQEKYKKLKAAGMPSLTQLKDWPEDFKKKDGTLPAECKVAEGKSFIRLKATKSKTKKDGSVMEFQDISIIDEYGDAIVDSIANGSLLRCLAHLEPAAKGSTHKALRLKTVVVVDLIVYEESEGSFLPTTLGLKSKAAKVELEENSDEDDIFAL